MSTHMSTHMSIHMSVHMFVHMFVHMSAHMLVPTSLSMRADMSIHVSTQAHTKHKWWFDIEPMYSRCSTNVQPTHSRYIRTVMSIHRHMFLRMYIHRSMSICLSIHRHMPPRTSIHRCAQSTNGDLSRTWMPSNRPPVSRNHNAHTP